MRLVGVAGVVGAVAFLVACADPGTSPDPPTPEDAIGIWRDGPAMPGPRMRHSSAVYRGDLYVAGGIVGPGQHTASVIRLKPGATAWEEVAPMPYELAGMSLVVVSDTLFAVGGDGPRFSVAEQALFAYDADADVWSARLPIPDQRLETEAVEVHGKLWLTGGPVVVDGDHSRDIPGKLVLEYTPGADAWEYGVEVPNPRVDHEAVLATDGRLYLIGGRDPTAANKNAQLDVLDTEGMGWVTVADSFATHRIGATYAAPFVHIVGGAATLDWHRTLDTRDHTWTRQPRLPYQVEWPQLRYWEDELWLVGGLQSTEEGDLVLLSRVVRLDLDDLGKPRD